MEPPLLHPLLPSNLEVLHFFLTKNMENIMLCMNVTTVNTTENVSSENDNHWVKLVCQSVFRINIVTILYMMCFTIWVWLLVWQGIISADFHLWASPDTTSCPSCLWSHQPDWIHLFTWLYKQPLTSHNSSDLVDHLLFWAKLPDLISWLWYPALWVWFWFPGSDLWVWIWLSLIMLNLKSELWFWWSDSGLGPLDSVLALSVDFCTGLDIWS